jgi:hypothetical protein
MQTGRPGSRLAVAWTVTAVVVIAAAVAWVSSSAAGRHDESAPGSATQTHAPKAPSATRYPQLAPADAIKAALDGLPQQDFAELKVVSAPDGPAARWMHATMNVDSSDAAGGSEVFWEACLAEGAIAEHLSGSIDDLDNVLAGANIKARYPDGTTEVMGGCGGRAIAGTHFVAQEQGWSDSKITDLLVSGLTSSNQSVDRVDVLHPLGPAVAVTVTVSSTATLEADVMQMHQTLLGDPYRYEGVYLEVRSTDGSPLAKLWTAFRGGTGTSWYAACTGIEAGFGTTDAPPTKTC